MDDLRTGGNVSNANNRYNPMNMNPNMLMTVLIGLVIIILLILLFQWSSPNSSDKAGTNMAYTNPLNATMRNNPLINTPQRAML
ncbi:occlusion-derived virus envelope protein ODV-E18 peptide [Spodoptera littoralis nucleopolyhedrovirus]|uniref:Odv-e18 n=2 Tax=Alphabaculovirus TaxID=558016 RepID=Q91BK3_NPVST|nr:occlusion-derived virus envelope protein ODV-E18 peptide [Spodoptera litura nucleopolyhedrovirus]YP_009505819.1 occlusion-derived virus envelope protein ODV-E18 peptide [Spodoptera littoralis nucleopolyhedrovirus]AAL01698.1 occlusion-derived virus envelope protein ODV-E18 peptide [Spodoptera litura nucleopolyhedrovirus]AGE89865.1 occlusion-derived virus envelope protein ODV-E18 peptide [Spodoptera littoralis nucleopolyhedrovirus]AYU75203.1 occlusion-derived virus envelope protein ODV-E18 pep